PGVKKTGARFERGFLAVCETNGSLDENPVWSTVREVNAIPVSDRARADSLRVVTGVAASALCTLAELTKPVAIEELVVLGPDWDYQAHRWEIPDEVAAFGKISVLPKLRRLVLRGSDRWTGSDPNGYPHRGNPALAGVSPQDLTWAWTAPCARDLDELTF